MTAYEQALARDFDWSLREGSMHFEEKNAVHNALRKLSKRLDDLHIPYAVAGAMALYFHGVRRFTEDVDVLVTRAGLKQIRQELEGLGYVPLFAGSKNLRDTENGVRVEFIITGDFPGDGKPKPVAFPDPQNVSEKKSGISFVRLPSLIELKLASGMTNPGRLKDLADVQEIIKTLQLPAELADELNPFVREKYRELWGAVQENPR